MVRQDSAELAEREASKVDGKACPAE